MIVLADQVEYITVKEAAKILKVSDGRVYQLLSEKRIPSVMELGRRLLPKKEVRRFARTRSKKPGPVPQARSPR